MNPFSRLFFLTTCFLFIFFSLSSASPVPDTGQSLCYDDAGNEIDCAGSGQDGSESINPMSYEKLDDEGYVLSPEATTWAAVRDKVTGLVWEVKSDANKKLKYFWGAAPSESSDLYVDDFLQTLNTKQYAGCNDWRMPTIYELAALGSHIDDDTEDIVKTDTDYFPNTNLDTFYWSSSPYISEFPSVGAFDFRKFLTACGFTHDITYPGIGLIPGSKQALCFRAVSGMPQEGIARFHQNQGEFTVTDTETGLMWELESADKYATGTFDWDGALEYCNTLTLDGYQDWRLPTMKEILSIINCNATENYLYSEIFKNTKAGQTDQYWTSTFSKMPAPNETKAPLCISFHNYGIYSGKRGLHAIAVRGGQTVIDGNLLMTSPAQGECLEAGNMKRIIWNKGEQALQGNISISLSTDGGKSYEFIIQNTENDGEYLWNIPPELNSVNCMLKLTPLEQSQAYKGTTQGLFKVGPLLGIQVGEPTGKTHEDGSSATFPVRLKTQPDGTVVLSIESDNPLEGIVSQGNTLTFEPDDYGQPQLVMFEGIDDDIADGSVAYHACITVDQGLTSDETGYKNCDPILLSLVNGDDDTASLVASQISNVVLENGPPESFTVRITSKPTHPVIVTLNTPYPDECHFSPTSLTFNPATWNATQTVTVTALADNSPDNDMTFDIELKIDKEKTFDTSGYTGLQPVKVPVTTINTDPGIRLTHHITGIPHCHKISESGLTSSFSAKLILPPDNTVVVDIACSDPSEGRVSPQQLTFTPTNWEMNQLVTIIGVDDKEIDKEQEFQIEVSVNASATRDATGYKKVTPLVIQPVRNADDNDWENIGMAVSDISGTVTENGGSATFHVALATVPNGDVIVDVTSSNEAEASVSPATLVFAPETWNEKKTVTVTGVPDSKEDGEKEVTVQLSVNGASSDTTGYKDTAATKVPFKSSDAPSSSDNVSKSPEAQGQDTGGGCFIQSLHHGLP
ncbi:DUF1566 domain-containing protein [Desulfoluna butyratoxydans]|uniref:Lcl C-terminal domain-containing protein n=1 Tax=Desulfoluna butyratoxydans TaxID=231438 RepID=A0A4U8YR19_9BACT|nr:DUF1566 domain-containing protein [Desulfoluna butyratoxydans]VFQ46164.1 protein of unknown function duf1566 [Desulfoluna butyratoxydans]